MEFYYIRMLDKETITMTSQKPSRSKNSSEAFQRCLQRVKQLADDGVKNEKLLRAIDRYLKLKRV